MVIVVKMIVGLGNPGNNYNNTRHNVGFMVLEKYFPVNKDWHEKFQALYSEQKINGEKVLFVKPTTFMNLSGDSVVKFFNFYKLSIDDILIIQDDLDQKFGSFKLKKNSSAGGHNGIKSIINRLNSQEFARLKIGVSNNKSIDTKDYVLAKFSKEELNKLEEMQGTFESIINSFVSKGIEATMNVYNTK